MLQIIMIMKKLFLTLIYIIFFTAFAFTQHNSGLSEKNWVDSIFKSLSKDERIAQLMVIRAHSNLGADHVAGVIDLITKFNVGALCFFQGGPVRQANLTNKYQSLAKTPLMVTIDGEWGLGMRLDSVIKYPYQLTLGALTNEKVVYEMGRAVGDQMKRIGVHVNYAPVVDVNNNPNNPVIGYRSFGEDKYRVAKLGVAYTKGMQDAGIMACAKHFPGHGDTEVDSHYDLPVISKTMRQLDSLELYPFKELFKAGVGSVMIAHLSIPAIDKTPNRPTSLSKNNIDELLRDEMEYKGLTFTDALEMKGVTKFFPAGEAAVQAIIAGNDMLCLPENVPAAIVAIKAAIRKKRIKQKDIDNKVKRVLHAKYQLGLHKDQFVDTINLLADLNSKTEIIKKEVAKDVVTVLRDEGRFFPFSPEQRIAYVGIGATQMTSFGNRLVQDFKADTFLLSYKDDESKVNALLQHISVGKYDAIVIGVHDFNYRPANNYNISAPALKLWNGLQKFKSATFLFGNVYAAKNFCKSTTFVAMHQDEWAFQQAAANFLKGSLSSKGVLPVTVCSIKYGSGMVLNNMMPVGKTAAWVAIDSIVRDAIAQKAFPGAVVYAAHNGIVKYHKAFGQYEYDSSSAYVTLGSVYDLASVTKISATTVSAMKLYEEGKLDLNKTIGDYLPWTLGTDKAKISIRDILLHQSGFFPFIPFYKETLDSTTRAPKPSLYKSAMDTLFTIPVARNLYLRKDWNDTMFQRILNSPLSANGKYVYSDNNFIFLGKIVEAISGLPLDQYAKTTFYEKLGMSTSGFNPWKWYGSDRTVPTEAEKHFRQQLLRGYVHDEGSSMFGGVAGHAGLFSNAFDLAKLYQMLLNGGVLNGEQFLQTETISLFTRYNSDVSRRGYGFDKPDKDNATAKNPYPSLLASPESFGHTGFTGTCVWVDPKADLVFIFLSNRVYPTRENSKLSTLNVRSRVQDAIYKALSIELNSDKTAHTY